MAVLHFYRLLVFQSVLLVEETGEPGENHQHVVSH
jgi:hypothetical protein